MATPFSGGVRLKTVCIYVCVYPLYHQRTIPNKTHSSGKHPAARIFFFIEEKKSCKIWFPESKTQQNRILYLAVCLLLCVCMHVVCMHVVCMQF